jgi:hypothetical protein
MNGSKRKIEKKEEERGGKIERKKDGSKRKIGKKEGRG